MTTSQPPCSCCLFLIYTHQKILHVMITHFWIIRCSHILFLKTRLFKDILAFPLHSFPPLCRTNLAKQPEVSQYSYRTSQPVTSSRGTLVKEQEKFGKVPFDYASFDAQVFGKRTTAPVSQGRKTPQFLECKLEIQFSLEKGAKCRWNLPFCLFCFQTSRILKKVCRNHL